MYCTCQGGCVERGRGFVKHAGFAAPVWHWFATTLGQPTPIQVQGWPKIRAGNSALLVAPTGSGKTLAAFLAGLDRLMFAPAAVNAGVKLLYVSPLKALAVDIDRNLRGPLAGIEQAALDLGHPVRIPTIALRTGDTPAIERTRFRRHSSEILMTTPESLFLLLTSEAARHLATVETVIVDEVHALFSTKRGAHLALSLERLQALRAGNPLQRIGLSATVNPVEQAAAWLAGSSDGAAETRVIDIVDAAEPPRLQICIEVPVHDMASMGPRGEQRSLWPAIYAPLVDLIRQHRTTLIFVNSRGLAERLSADLNEHCGEPLVQAHHGAVARERRLEIEAALKHGQLRGLVATSTLELGIDMGTIELVVQIEAPPSVASGLQRMGRAGHQVGGTSKAVVFPKFRGDLLAAAATAELMKRGAVEALHIPQRPLDVLAQQVVAIVSMGAIDKQALLELIRGAAPYQQLSDSSFDGVLDMLSGRYPADEFAELRPRINWDRRSGMLSARPGAQRLALVNAGTIPDHGLYGVFLAGEGAKRSHRVGELDEEMVFESRVGDVFVLGASSWRIEDITVDRVLVSPAPGEPGRMPFWHGDRAGRSLALGQAVGRLARTLDTSTDADGLRALDERGLTPVASQNLIGYVRDQHQALGCVPNDEQIVVESFLDEIGDYRVCILSPLGARIHAPWAIAAMQLQRVQLEIESQAVWFDDGIVFRFPRERLPTLAQLVPDELQLDELLQQGLLNSALFASTFRECAARALLLPRRMPGRRTPLWAQRRRAADLLRAAGKFPEFPMLLEALRECMADAFDLQGLRQVLQGLRNETIRIRFVAAERPSPFAAALLFSYAGNFLYDGDAPLAERQAHALTVNQAELRGLLGELELRHLLDPDAIAEVENEVRRRSWRLQHADDLHDLLVVVGDLSRAEIAAYNATAPTCTSPEPLTWLYELEQQLRVVAVSLAGTLKYIAVEDVARYRALVDLVVPAGISADYLQPVRDPIGDIVARYARTHGPFATADLCRAYPMKVDLVDQVLAALEREGRITSGYFLPHGSEREWCDTEVLRRIKQRSLKRLRQQVTAVEPASLTRLLIEWQGVAQPRRGLDVLATALEQLQGMPLLASALESEILPARAQAYLMGDIDALISSGEFLWQGLEPVGTHDGRIAVYLAEQYPYLAPSCAEAPGDLAAQLRQTLHDRGASFFAEMLAATGAFAPELLDALWSLVWSGEVTNDSLLPLRSRMLRSVPTTQYRRASRHRQTRLAGSEGRWSLTRRWLRAQPVTPTEQLTHMTNALLDRYGVLVSEAFAGERSISFAQAYPVLKALEETGKVRRGYFVKGLAATQFALPGADDRLRLLRDCNLRLPALVLSAVDPANPYGTILPWPACEGRPQRVGGARVIIHDGRLLAYVSRSANSLITFGQGADHDRDQDALTIANALKRLVDTGRQRTCEICEVNAGMPQRTSLGAALKSVGFTTTSSSYFYRGAAGHPPTDVATPTSAIGND